MYQKKRQIKELTTASILKSLNISNQTLLTLLGLIVLGGGTYGGYTVIKGQPDLDQQVTNFIYSAKVVDGDTFDTNTGDRVRIALIDAPETNECFGKESTIELEKLLQGKRLATEKDITSKDNFGRYVRHVWIVGENKDEPNILVSKYLLEKGYARYSLDKSISYRSVLVNAEKEAQTKLLGMWGQCPGIPLSVSSNRKIEENVPPNDPKCIIKSNISDLGFGKKYFLPGCPNYDKIKIDPSKGESYFCTEEEAVKAGFVKSESCQSTGR